jgi:NAD(P)-dependent dehydrogenase (short-subunit alcohol dehydrogenase family)
MRLKLKPVDEQVVVVMEAAGGIGRQTALELARAGARLVVSAASLGALESLVSEIRHGGGHAIGAFADAAVFAHVSEVARTAEREFGALDTWVQPAAAAVDKSFEKITPAELAQVIAQGLVGQAYGAMAAIPVMKRHGGGQFIHISSVEAELALPARGVWAAAERGVAGMLDSLRIELKRQGAPIAISNVIPPIYDPGRVAKEIVRLAVRPRREVIVGAGGKALIALRRHFPRLAEALLTGDSRAPKRLGAIDDKPGGDEPFLDRTERDVPVVQS